MSTILVQPPSSRDQSTLIELTSGQSLTFGRGAPDLPVGLQLKTPGVSRLAGEVTAGVDYWYLTNRSHKVTYAVENLESADEYIRVGPRRVGVPVPFEISSVTLPAGTSTVAFRVYAPEQPTLLGDEDGPAAGTRTTATFPLDESAKYFLVLVAMCEARLRGSALAPLPTVTEVARRLKDVPGCENLAPRAIDFHIDYLARAKLHLHGCEPGRPTGFAGRREAVVTFALRFGLVRPEHLILLSGSSSRSARGTVRV